MARGRMLNKTVSVSYQFDQLPDDTCRLLATWIIAHLDVNGVFYGDPVVVRSMVFPRRADISNETVELYLCEMEQIGLITRYEAAGQIWQCWEGFRHQQVGLRADRETPEFPPPPSNLPERCRKDAGKMPEESRQDSAPLVPEGEGEGEDEGEKEAAAAARTREPDDDDELLRPIASDERLQAFSAYERACGVLSPMNADEIGALVNECEAHRRSIPRGSPGANVMGDEWVVEAIKMMAAANARNLSYARSILDRWRRDGYKSAFPEPGGDGRQSRSRDRRKAQRAHDDGSAADAYERAMAERRAQRAATDG